MPNALPPSPARLTIVAVIVASVFCAFVYVGGWLSPTELTPAKFADRFEEVGGSHPGFRRNHAKGVGVSGTFQSNGSATRLSKAWIFRPGIYRVLGRFSFGGGLPDAPDNPAAVRGLGLRFTTPDTQEWRTAMINLPVFPVPTPQAFYDLLVASAPDPVTGKPNPAKMKPFIEANLEFAAAIKIIGSHPPSSGFDNSTFSSLNAFFFTNDAGQRFPIRWQFVPVESAAATTPASTQPNVDKNSLLDALIVSIHKHAIQYRLMLIIGEPGDSTTDATLPWPDTRERVDAGTLTLDHVEAEETSPARDVNFDPLILPGGISPSDDPLLSARSAVYSQSYTRRAAEAKTPSAISPADVNNGGHP